MKRKSPWKTYTVRCSWTVSDYVEVRARSVDEAEQKAHDTAVMPDDAECDAFTAEVCEET